MKTVRKKKKSKKFILCLILLLLTAAGVSAWFYIDSLAYKVCRVEAGVNVLPSNFMKDGNAEAFFTEESQEFDITVPGTYQIVVKSGWFTHKATLYIEDTIAPQAQAVTVELQMGEVCVAEDLVTDIMDATRVMTAFVKKPDFTQPGSQKVTVRLTDQGENITEIESEIYIAQVIEELTVEAGSKPPTLEEFVVEAHQAEFVTDMAALNMNTVADYKVTIVADDRSYEPVLHVVDTVAPRAEVQDVSGYALVPRSAEEFIVSVEDATSVSATFIKEPDLTFIGTQEVELSLKDEGNNETVMTASLTLEADTQAPVISGISNIQLVVGDTVSYKKNIKVTDNCEEGLTLDIDSSTVNLNAEGSYQVTYTATDLAGNITSKTITVTVYPKLYTEEQVNELADAVLAKIIKPEMTALEKVQAIYNYNMSHISYINHSEKINWIQGAYEGLVFGKGDCYVYACTAKVLLTRAGITNMDIEKIPAKTMHYWNLVDIGDGWYHFDTTPRKDHPTIFMWTDVQLMEYSAQHYNSHNYDHDQYPTVN